MADPDYFTLDEFRQLPDMSSGNYSDERIGAAAAYFTAIVERETGMSFSPHEFTTTLDGTSSGDLRLPHTSIRSVSSVTINGEVVSVTWDASGALRRVDGGWWPAGYANVTVTYTAGFTDCPADIKDPLMWAVRDRLLATSDTAGIDARRTSTVTDMGTINYVIAGENRPTGYPDLDAAIMGRRRGAPYFGML